MRNSIGLPEFKIIDVYEDSEGRSIKYEVEALNPPRFCPKCACVGSHYKHSVEKRVVHDLKSQEKLVYLEINSRRYKCNDCDSTFQEEYECIDGRERLTVRLREHIKELCLKDTFASIARDYS